MVVVVFRFTDSKMNEIHKNGFGDLVRGLISIKQIQQIMGFELLVDMKGHFSGKFFKDHCPIIYDHDTIFKIYGNENNNLSEIKDTIEEEFNKGYNIITITSNHYPVVELFQDPKKKQDMIDFMKKVFILTPQYEKYFNERCEKIGKDYDLLHYRFGDFVLVDGHNIRNINFYINHILSNKTENTVLISDSFEIKEKILNMKTNIKVLLNKPFHSNSHMCDTHVKTNKTEQDYFDLIFDFLLVKNAKSVGTFNIYGWTSNFVLWTSMIYGIPLKILPNSHYIKNM